MKILHLSLFCLFLCGCVSEQWVRGYVQHEMAGVKDIVTEEVYPLEKAVMDVKTQMATIVVEVKEVKDELQVIKGTLPVNDKKWEEIGQRVAKLEMDLTKLEALTEDLKKLHLGQMQIQPGTETTSKGEEPIKKP